MSGHYTVMYKGENIYSYKMTANEEALVESLREECIKVCDDLCIPRGKCVDGSLYMGRLKDNPDFHIKYKTDIGFYVLEGERGIFSMRTGFPEQDKEKAKFLLLLNEFRNGGFQYELEHRKKLQHIWEKKYDVRYDGRKAAFEYAIQKNIEISSCFTELFISKYTDFMNKWFDEPHWIFNKKKSVFEEKETSRNVILNDTK